MSLLPSAAEPLLNLSADVVLALVGLGVPAAVLAVACGIAWALSPNLANGRA